MSLVQHKEVIANNGAKRVEAMLMRAPVDKKGNIIAEVAPYVETEQEQNISSLILKHFILSTVNQYTPRVEFNDLSLVTRDQLDQMSFNTYQPNNGEAWEGDQMTAWRSRAIRPVVRNKCMSIAAHATARLIFPKVFAYNDQSEEQQDAAQVMEDLMEWSGDVSNYPHTALMRVITAMSSPASIGYTEYGEVTRMVKTEKDANGQWIEERIIDEAYPCFTDCVVPVTQLYIENIYEPDIQKQGFLIWRKVYAYSEAQVKYQEYDNFKFVRPGVQTIYDDANRQFYYVYDPNMRQEDVEEIVYWNKTLDLKIIKVNGIMMTDVDNPNPRKDKLYPFDKFYYEPINSRFFYGKSLAFKLQHDADVVNTLYQMVIDGTYLSIFKPMVNVGGEIIASDVIVPGAVTTLSDPNADLRAINVGSDLEHGLKTLAVVEQSISESSQEPLQQGNDKNASSTTAYEISRLEANANTVLGLFLQMIAKHVKDFGKLRLGDIVQYLTVPEVIQIEDDMELVYKTFFVTGKSGGDNKRIQLDNNMPDSYSEDEYLDASYDLYIKEEQSKMTISKVNPGLFRQLKYQITISPDVLNPKSDELMRAFDLETYDRMVAAPPGMFDPEETGKLLLHTNPTTKRDVDKYAAKQPDAAQQAMQQSQSMAQPGKMPQAGNAPLNSMGKKGKPQQPAGQSTQLPQLATMGQ